jgi:uncharacterized protein involved in exopolysaccharide biosynthesis
VELRDYLGILRRRWVSVLLVALTVLLAAAAVTFSMTKQYTATLLLVVALRKLAVRSCQVALVAG